MPVPAFDAVYRYHDGTKHHFHRFARSLGYLDWASQPRPFRSYEGARRFPLYPDPRADAAGYRRAPVTFDDACGLNVAPAPISAAALGDLLRHALGLSAWKQFGTSRWSLRVNPSSGNLHPTEAYVVAPPLPGLADVPAVYHYAPDRHELELRCRIDAEAWDRTTASSSDVVLVALTSIHWREAWKYGERAFRYCQHDLGHAAAALSMAAGVLGWHARICPRVSHGDLAALTGVGRAGDFVESEPEEPGLIVALSSAPIGHGQAAPRRAGIDGLVRAAGAGTWSGRPSQLSEDHVTWSFIEDIARATRDPGQPDDDRAAMAGADDQGSGKSPTTLADSPPALHDRDIDARTLLLRRRSALAFDGRTSIGRSVFLGMLARCMPGATLPWPAQWWTPRVHLVVFAHRVEGMQPGIYALVREPSAFERLRAACRAEFLWEAADDTLPLRLLAPIDARALSARLSCDQSIASDGFFSLGMLADFEQALERHGPSFYRNLFWETGMIGQVLYLEAEAAGARGTGIGCFYDDPVHEVLGLQGHTFQSLYHFTVGQHVEDARLTTEPGYGWERGANLTESS